MAKDVKGLVDKPRRNDIDLSDPYKYESFQAHTVNFTVQKFIYDCPIAKSKP